MDGPVETITFYPEDPRWARVPVHLRAGLDRWITKGIEPGSFLSSVIQNDLYRAWLYGDDTSKESMSAILGFLHYCAPATSFGSVPNFLQWKGGGGLEGRRRDYTKTRAEG